MKAKGSASKRILVVDHQPLVCDAFRRMLTPQGYRVDTAGDGADALAKYKRGQYSVVVTGFLMSDMDGLELAQAIKAVSPAQPIILLTGFAERVQAEGNRCSSVDLVLEKPCTVKEFQAALDRVLAGE